MKEGEWTGLLTKQLRDAGATVFKIFSTAFQPGIPDMFIAWQGESAWIEIKSPSGDLRPIQRKNIKSLRVNGFQAYVLRYSDTELTLEDDAGRVIKHCRYNRSTIAFDLWRLLYAARSDS